jgi:hypothetical protein
MPGLFFEVQPPSLSDPLPRMDVAGFVGFAASGPLDLPVAVDDVEELKAVFGTDAPLAWDPGRGEIVNGLLLPAVGSFFRNGGRRCWVVRVAGPGAVTNRFPVPALALCLPAAAPAERFAPAQLDASSPGSWSDAMQVACALETEPFAVDGVAIDGDRLAVRASGSVRLAAGDLVRWTDRASGEWAVLRVDAVDGTSASGADLVSAAPAAAGDVAACTSARWATGPELASAAIAVGSPDDGLDAPGIVLSLPAPGAPAPGALLQLLGPGGADPSLWLRVTEVRPHPEDSQRTLVQGPIVRLRLGAPPPVWLSSASRAERLTFDLRLDDGQGPSVEVADLGFAPGHARFWGALESDAERFGDTGSEDLALTVYDDFRDEGLRRHLRVARPAEGWRELDRTRSPGAAPDPGWERAFSFPIEMAFVSDEALGTQAPPADAPERDGLATLDVGAFLDRALVSVRTNQLLSQAGYVRYQSPRPRALTGLHALLHIDEITLLAVPDAVQLAWVREPAAALPDNSTPPLSPPDAVGDEEPPLAPHFLETPIAGGDGSYLLRWAPDAPEDADAFARVQRATTADFADAAELFWGSGTSVAVAGQGPGIFFHRVRLERAGQVSDWSAQVVVTIDFADCAITVLLAPHFLGVPDPGEGDSFTLSWDIDQAPPATAVFVVQEANRSDFSDSREVFRGNGRSAAFYGRLPGAYQFRVRVEDGAQQSPWSAPITVLVEPARGGLVRLPPTPPAPFDDGLPTRLGAIHRAMLRFCAARGDVLAVLGLPEHFREDDALAYLRQLEDGQDAERAGVPPLYSDERRTLSFGAVYHPWPIGRLTPEQPLVRQPPDGAVTGMIARRALQRGAWVAPANQPLDGVLALTPALDPRRRVDLFDAQINSLAQLPQGFVALSCDTRSPDADLRPLSVRRLLSLLRRAAQQRGNDYVFEPNDPAFRRMVERGFEDLLGLLYARGAFAGSTAAASFQVDTGDALNSAASVDAGRFVVELKVAPSLPLEFLTVRLVQNGEGSVVSEVA